MFAVLPLIAWVWSSREASLFPVPIAVTFAGTSIVSVPFACRCVAAPPESAGLYVEPAPTMNLSRRSGVLFVPSQRTKPLGIETIDPFQIRIMPLTTSGPTKAIGSESLRKSAVRP